MKNLVRAFALSLVALGAVASIHASTNTPTNHVSLASAMPPPQCNPDGTSCGL